MPQESLTRKALSSLLKPIQRTWGRLADRPSWSGFSLSNGSNTPDGNPDETDNAEKFEHTLIPFHVAGMIARDISSYFVSAAGMEPDENGAYFPPQLVWGTKQQGDATLMKELAWQYDSGFDCRFNTILKSLDDPCKSYGWAVAELEWVKRDDGLMYTPMVWSRDVEEYVVDPPEKAPGLYRERQGRLEVCNPLQFLHYAYDPLYNNPYGTSINRPLKRLSQSFIKWIGYLDHAIEKASMGFLIGYYEKSLSGESDYAKAEKAQFFEALKKATRGTASIFHKDTEVTNQKLEVEAQLFFDALDFYIQTVSVLYTGSATALTEGKYGSRAKSEATEVREKANREWMDAFRVESFWSFQYNRVWAEVNFSPNRTKILPELQLIQRELMMPTTPQGQETAQEVVDGKQESLPKQDDQQELMSRESPVWIQNSKAEEIQQTLIQKYQGQPQLWGNEWTSSVEFQEDDDDAPYTPPAVPPTYKDFPNTTTLPEDYRDIIVEAQEYLDQMPVKLYQDVQPSEAHNVFTIKRFRGFVGEGRPKVEVERLLDSLKQAIIPTLEAENEDIAWQAYWTEAINIFRTYGFEQPSPQLRSSLIISFRQARQNALNEGYYQSALNDPGVIGLRIKNDEDVKTHHASHVFWDGVALPKDHPELQLSGRLRIPMDFGCQCRYEKVLWGESLTPMSDYPKVFPGGTYQFYVQPSN